jgi:glycosyltransferase involved in cell wall biosynthesis
MRIGILQTRYLSPHPAGGEIHTDNLAEAFQQAGHDVRVYTAAVDDERAVTTPTHSYSVPVNVKPVAGTVLAHQAVPTINAECDVCILTDGSAWYAAPRLTVPTAMVFHFVWHGYNRRKSWRNRLLTPHHLVYEHLEDAVVEHADAIVSISPNVTEDILRIDPGISDKIHPIPNGVDTTRFRPTDDRFEEFTAHFQGQLVDVKNPDLLIRAAAESTHPWNILIGGTGPLREELEQLTEELAVEDRVRFAGFVDDEDLPAMYAHSHVSVLPSDYEGMPLTVLEATACGTMPIVSERAATDYVTDEFGIVLEHLTPTDLATTLDRCYAQQDWVEERSTAARTAAEALDWQRIAQEYLALLETISGDRPPVSV